MSTSSQSSEGSEPPSCDARSDSNSSDDPAEGQGSDSDEPQNQRQGFCVVCGQRFGEVDMDAPEGSNVTVESKGGRATECKACYNVRTGTFGKQQTAIMAGKRTKKATGVTVKASSDGQYFPQLLKKHGKLKKQFFSTRKQWVQNAANGSGSGKKTRFTFKKVELKKLIVRKKKEKFNRVYQPFELMPLTQYCNKNKKGKTLKTMDERRKWVESLGLKVVQNSKKVFIGAFFLEARGLGFWGLESGPVGLGPGPWGWGLGACGP